MFALKKYNKTACKLNWDKWSANTSWRWRSTSSNRACCWCSQSGSSNRYS